MTRSEQIRSYATTHPDLSITQIAKAIGCKPEYVRVVLRQRNGTSSKADLLYRSTPRGRATNCANVAACRAKRKVQTETADPYEVNERQRLAYRAARARGCSKHQAAAAAWSERARAIRELGNNELAQIAADKARLETRARILNKLKDAHDVRLVAIA